MVQILGQLRVPLCLLYADIVERSEAEVLYGAGLEFLAVVHVAFDKRVAGLREFDFALDVVLHHEAELVAQAFDEPNTFFGRFAGKAVLACDFFEFLVRELVCEVFQKPDARDVFGACSRPCDTDYITLVLVVRSREVELVPVLENVEFVFEVVEVVPMVLQGERVKDGLPARTELAERLEATVKSRVVEPALAGEHLAVLDGDECALQHRFRFDFAGGVTINGRFVDDAHEEYGARLELRRENLVHIAAGELGEVVDGLFGDNTLQLSEVQLERLQPAGRIEEHAIHGAVEVVALAGIAGPVRELSLGEHETAQLQLQVADVCL